jgi:3-hydroxy-D-aspartate aldolase
MTIAAGALHALARRSNDMSAHPPARVGAAIDEIDTPALIVELDALERNLDRMANAVAPGIALRPHAKSHKCPPIALAQRARGAVGVCCQTVAEAEGFVHAGIDDVLVTNEVVGAPKLARLAAIARRAKIGVLADDVDNVSDLARAAERAGVVLRALVEVDVGAHRCGVAPGTPAVRIAQAIAQERALAFGGVHAYHGAAQHRRTPQERRDAIASATALARETRDAIQAAGIACPLVTGAGTGTWPLEHASGVYTELQPGSYVFMDADYARNTPDGDDVRFEQSLFVLTTVMSTAAERHVIVDAGLKALAFDSGMPLVRGEGVSYERASDEHGTIAVEGAAKPRLGARLWLIPGHCDPTVNLYDWIVGVRGGYVETVWPVVARGH